MFSFSAWSCLDSAKQITSTEGFSSEESGFGVDCLESYCYNTNVAWAILALLTIFFGILAAVRKSWCLSLFVTIFFALRGFFSVIEMVLAVADNTSCQAWTLSKNPWLPVIGLTNVLVFVALSTKFAGTCRHPSEANTRFAGDNWWSHESTFTLIALIKILQPF